MVWLIPNPSNAFLFESAISTAEAERLEALASNRVVVEIGSWFGYSTILMAQVARKVHAIDWHRGDDHAGRRSTLPQLWDSLFAYGVQNKVVLHVGRSQDVLPLWSEAHFDLAFIDGYHTKEAVLQDYSLLDGLVHRGGLFAFHDYGRYGVKDALDQVLGLPDVLVESLAIYENRRRA